MKARNDVALERISGPRVAAWRTVLSVLALAAVFAAPSSAQLAEAGWLPWYGCWEAVAEGPSATGSSILCFRPGESPAAVDVLSVEDGVVVSTESIVADGRPVETSLEGCVGNDRGHFSQHPGRIYLTSDHVCEGGVERRTTGLFSMVSPNAWVDIKVIDVAGETMTWVSEYRAARAEAVEELGLGGLSADRALSVNSARIAASRRATLDDLIEVTGRVAPEGAEAWIAETRARFDLDGAAIVSLADAGVPESVIDVAVAMSFPSRFAVADDGYGRTRQEGYAGYGVPLGYGGYGLYGPYGYGSFGRLGFGGYYDPYFINSFYSPFGIGSRLGGFGGFYRPALVVVDRRGSGGRVIPGQGYRRGSGGSTGRTAVQRSGGQSGSAGAARTSTGSGSAARSGSTGRKAKPRPGGRGGGG